MSTPQLFRSFVIERLTASAVEIFRVFERTVEKYEEEASGFKQEIAKLRSLLQEEQQRTDVSSQLSICKEEVLHESQDCEMELSLIGQLEDTEPCNVKEESSAERAAQPQAAVEDKVEQFESVDVLKPSQSLISEQDGSDSTNWDIEEEQMEDGQVSSPLSSTPSPQTVVESDNSEIGSESEQLTEVLQTFVLLSRESTQLQRVSLRNCQCLLCSKYFSYSKHLINHAIRMHSHDSNLLCAVCGKTFETTESLNLHLQTHKNRKFCCMCDEEFSSVPDLIDHIAIHSEADVHRCNVCGKLFNGKAALKAHKRIHLVDNQYCCSLCGRGFAKLGYLFRHIKSHGVEWPHRCDICGGSFLRPSHLRCHLNIHAKQSDTSEATK